MALVVSSPGRPWYRRRLFVFGAPLVVVLATLFIVFVWAGRGAKEVSVDDALARYRSSQPTEVTVRSGARFEPRPGVYEYRASGREKLSLLNTTQQWGPKMFGTVTADGKGCWSFSALFNSHHDQQWQYCARGDTLYEQGGVTNQKFDFGAFSAKDKSVFTCPTPGVVLRAGEKRGMSAPILCKGHGDGTNANTTSKGTITFVGIEHVTVAGDTVETYHVRSGRTVGGDQEGTDEMDSWFATRDAMLVKFTRHLRVTSPSPVGHVTYREDGSFTLVSQSPRR
jgi:hypothetical protein